MAKQKPAETWPVGSHLADELAARRLTPQQFARTALVPLDEVQSVLDGGYMSLAIAERIALALGVSPALLLNLQLAHKRGTGNGN